MRRLKHLIKRFDFNEDNRGRITLGPNVRINPELNRLELRLGATNVYPTTADLYAKSWVTNPKTVKRWVGFMSDHKNAMNFENIVVTDVRFRLNDGVDDRYWNSGANQWVVAAPNNWNTEAEVSDHIAAFPITTQSLQVVINLSTSDPRYTPTLTSVRVLYESDLEEMEDYIWRSMLADIGAKIEPIGEYAAKLAADSATLELVLETPYNVSGIDAVYNVTADPNTLTDLFGSYDANTKIVTMSAVQALNSVIVVRFKYKPELAVTTEQDYTELQKVPQIIFDDIVQSERSESGIADFVIDKVTGAGKKVPITMGDLDVSGVFVTNKAKDHARISDALKGYFKRNPLLRSVGQDELFSVYLLDYYDEDVTANQQDLLSGRFRFRICKALFYDDDAVDVHGVLGFELALNLSPR